MICVHHNKDLDGYTSGAIVLKKYPDVKLFGWDYAEPFPELSMFKDEEVIFIDVTFPPEVIKDILLNYATRVTIIDHHVSFVRDFCKSFNVNHDPDKPLLYLNKNILYKYVPNKAACEIGWSHLFPEKPVPLAVTLLGRFDTWRKDEGDWEGETVPFQFYMRGECDSPQTFDPAIFSLEYLNESIRVGAAIVDYQEQRNKVACKRSSFVRKVGDLYAICLNINDFSSDTLITVFDPAIHDLMLGFQYTGKVWSVSLRSTADSGIDVSAIAKAKGGGGHKHAAGFEVPTFEDIFK